MSSTIAIVCCFAFATILTVTNAGITPLPMDLLPLQHPETTESPEITQSSGSLPAPPTTATTADQNVKNSESDKYLRPAGPKSPVLTTPAPTFESIFNSIDLKSSKKSSLSPNMVKQLQEDISKLIESLSTIEIDILGREDGLKNVPKNVENAVESAKNIGKDFKFLSKETSGATRNITKVLASSMDAYSKYLKVTASPVLATLVNILQTSQESQSVDSTNDPKEDRKKTSKTWTIDSNDQYTNYLIKSKDSEYNQGKNVHFDENKNDDFEDNSNENLPVIDDLGTYTLENEEYQKNSNVNLQKYEQARALINMDYDLTHSKEYKDIGEKLESMDHLLPKNDSQIYRKYLTLLRSSVIGNVKNCTSTLVNAYVSTILDNILFPEISESSREELLISMELVLQEIFNGDDIAAVVFFMGDPLSDDPKDGDDNMVVEGVEVELLEY